MSSSRRRFLAAVGAALVAGCNESSRPTRERTVTPVDVPRSEDGALEAAAEIPVPSVPPAAVVDGDHREAVVAAAEELLERAERELEAAAGIDLAEIDAPLRDPEDPFEAARRALDELREGPDPRNFRRFDRAFADAGTVLGYVRAEADSLDAGAVRAAVRRERDGYEGLQADVEYRLTTPVVQYLPTVAVAESALGHAGNRLDTVENRVGGLDETSGTPSSSEIAAAWRRVEQFRLARTNAAGFLGTGTEPSAAPRRDAIESAVERQLSALRSLSVPEAPGSEAGAGPERVRTILSTIGSRRSDLLDGTGRDVSEGPRRVVELLEAVRVRGELEAFGTAAAVTADRMDRGRLPAELLVEEKRRATDRLETLSAAAPLQRRVGALAVDMVTYGDRLRSEQGTNPTATAHFMYVGGRAFADRALTRGEALADALEDPDGPRK
ncbi:hypothetical protein [Natronomonas marina]|jgi:hypothetical protein|uniref:hypothetical protein n=1 Tax=Natronomonas marina TaxID=2961939 RepID=UPI0020C9A892|nr:hypothetical protein [Natronomonas marina]